MFAPSLLPENNTRLLALHAEMVAFYNNSTYHNEWIKGANANWNERDHAAQIEMCRLIPPNSQVLEIGCGSGSARKEIEERAGVRYIGMDLNPNLWRGRPGFAAGSALEMPIASGSFDVALSMFVLERIVFPQRFLNEAWRVLKTGGRLFIISPDFALTPMASERLGLSYGSGRDKLRRGRVWDAILTGYDTRIRIPLHRRRRLREIARGQLHFPVLLQPRCLTQDGFTVDCDAVYPSCPEEVIAHFSRMSDFAGATIFHRTPNAFGVQINKG